MIKLKKIKPMFTSLITTMDKYERDMKVGDLIDIHRKEGSLKEYQRVLAVGSSVRDIKVGDLVWVNPTRFGVKRHQEGSLKDGVISDNPIVTYNFDVVEMDGKQCLLLQDRDIDFIIEEWEDIPDPVPSPSIKQEKQEIIM